MANDEANRTPGELHEDEWGQAPSPPTPPELDADDSDAILGDEGDGDGASDGGGSGRVVLIVAAVAALLLAAGAYWWFTREEAPVEPEPVVETAPAEVEEEDAEEPLDLPPLDASDAFLRALLSTLVDHPDALAWLLGDDLARHIVVAVENIAEGNSPRRSLAGLAPSSAFQVAGTGNALHVHPDSYERYDSITAAISSADMRGLARATRQVLPLMDQAYAELGRPDRTFADALLAAVDRLTAVPVPDDPILLRQRTLRFEYRDEQLENLDDASKHLLRFGPGNQQDIQRALTRFAERFRAELATR